MRIPSETGPEQALHTAIVGAGPGCIAVMDVILGKHLRQLPLVLVGVADVNPRAPALERARAGGIFTTPDFRALFALPGLKLIIELTGDDAVARDIGRQKPEHVRLMDHAVARLFWDVIRLGDDKREAEKRYKDLFELAREGMALMDLEGRVRECNFSLARMTGYSREELKDKSLHELAINESAAILHSHLGDLSALGFVSVEMDFVTKAGDPIPVEAGIAWLPEERLFRIMVRDISTQRKLEESRKAYSERLEREVAQRTERLRASEKERERAERMAAVGRTVAGVAHYIKNILNGLKGGAYVIGSALSKSDIGLARQGWGMVERNIDQIGSIVQDMLLYSGEAKPAYEKVGPNDLVRDVVELMSEKAGISGVSLQAELDPGLGEVNMDRRAIHRCLLDLVSNAVDACVLEGILSGKGVVTVSTDRPRGWGVRFRVSDNGKGMDEATQRRLFSDFFTTKGYRGTGLGLPVTHKIVQDHGGSLTFETQVGRGTVFALTLPAEAPKGAAPGDDRS